MQEPTLRVLLLEDNPGDARLLLEGMRDEGRGTFDVTWTETVQSAGGAMRQRPFDAMLLDLNVADSRGFDTFTTVKLMSPNLHIVVLTGTEDETLGLRAVQEGAQDFLIKGQASPTSVARSIRFAVERNRSLQWHMSKGKHSPGGRVITFWGAKGGVGTTTLAINTAALLAREKLVVAAEMRGDYGSFGAHFRKAVPSNLSELYTMPPNEITEAQMEQRLVNTQLGFYLLFGPQSVAQCNPLTPALADRLMELTSRIADIAVIDLPSTVGAAHETIIRRSNCVALVSERDDSSVMAARLALERLRSWGVSGDAIHFLLVNRSTLLENVPKERIEEQVGMKITGVIPPSPDLCGAAQRASTPLALFRPRSATAAVLTQVAQRINATAAGPMAVFAAGAE